MRKAISYTLIIILTGFILLTLVVVLLPTTFVDIDFSKEVQEHQNPLLDTTMEAISWFGYTKGALITVLSTALLLLLARYKRAALFVVLTLLSSLVSTAVKALVNRPRPSASLVRIVQKTTQQSFPSGHVLFYVVFFGFITVLMYQLRRLNKTLRITVAAISLFLVFSIPASRIYLGAHWFTDVTAGFLLGLLCLYVLSFYYLKVTEK
jgi:undecaprenyl-diphosphatase